MLFQRGGAKLDLKNSAELNIVVFGSRMCTAFTFTTENFQNFDVMLFSLMLKYDLRFLISSLFFRSMFFHNLVIRNKTVISELAI